MSGSSRRNAATRFWRCEELPARSLTRPPSPGAWPTLCRSTGVQSYRFREERTKKSRFTQVGVDRLVCLSRLERVASLILADNKPDDIKAILQEDLKGSFRSSRTDVLGSIDKTITILMKVGFMFRKTSSHCGCKGTNWWNLSREGIAWW